jgi:cystathionine beta-lyase/cystathionine gamma-synthase
MTAKSDTRFETRAIHAGHTPDTATGSVMPPIHQTSTYVQDGVAEPRGGYVYARVSNPTRTALEENLASLEEGRVGAAFASGLAAIEALVKSTLEAGSHVVCGASVYGGTERMFRTVWSRFGVDFTYVDTTDLEELAAAMRPETRLVHIETPTNPMMQISDIAGCAEIAHAGGALLSVDNTFPTPFLQSPLALGADVVVHSTTKYLNGHSDVIGGAMVTVEQELGDRLRNQQRVSGGVPGPMDCWLVLRGIKTLHVRMERHCENASRVADFLLGQPAARAVLYPGLEDHPQHDLARRQMRGFGGMISFDSGSFDNARQVASATRVFQLAESLGGVESLISVPAAMTHASVPEDVRQKIGLTSGLVRLSVGIESAEDLIADLDRALASVAR